MSIDRLFHFGSLVPPGATALFPEVSEGSNWSQLGILRALLDCGVHEILAVTGLPIAADPRRRPIRVPSRRWHVEDGLDIISPGFLNAPVVKPLFMHTAVRRAGSVAARAGRPGLILCYNPVPGYASAALSVARRLRVPFVTLVADFTPPSALNSVLRAMQARWAQGIIRASDALIVHSGHVARDLGFRRPWLKIDGGMADDWDDAPPRPPLPKTIVYAGTPYESSGIRLLLSAFRLIRDPEMRLVVSGRGGLEDEIRAAAEADPRIEMVGFVDRGEMRAILRTATVLVNPRLSASLDNRYNFAGKLIDYLASSRPVITTLAGDLDQDYLTCTIPLIEETPEVLAALIEDVCARPEAELAALGAQGRQFVLGTRRWEHQARKIYEFLDSLPISRTGPRRESSNPFLREKPETPG